MLMVGEGTERCGKMAMVLKFAVACWHLSLFCLSIPRPIEFRASFASEMKFILCRFEYSKMSQKIQNSENILPSPTIRSTRVSVERGGFIQSNSLLLYSLDIWV